VNGKGQGAGGQGAGGRGGESQEPRLLSDAHACRRVIAVMNARAVACDKATRPIPRRDRRSTDSLSLSLSRARARERERKGRTDGE